MGIFRRKKAKAYKLNQAEDGLFYLDEAPAPSLASKLREGAAALQAGLEREAQEGSLLSRSVDWVEATRARIVLVALLGILCLALLCALVLILSAAYRADVQALAQASDQLTVWLLATSSSGGLDG